MDSVRPVSTRPAPLCARFPPQVFALNHDVPPGSHLMVVLHDKVQRQWEDNR